jgi:hypothetical protein
MRRLGIVVAGLCLPLVGCSGQDAAAPPGSDPSAPEVEAASCSDLFTDGQAAELVGSDVGTADEARVEELPACQWGSPGAGVQVISLPADEWIAQLPALIDGLERSGATITPDQRQRLDEGRELATRGGEATPDEACATFSTLAEVQGMPPGSDTVTNLFPDRKRLQVVSAQACSDGRFTSVTFGSPGLSEDVRAAVRDAEAALATVQENAD